MKKTLSIAFLSILLGACSHAPVKSTEAAKAEVVKFDYPTQVRVEYVLGCMQDHGGQNYDNMYHCICAVDKIAEKIPYDDFAQAQTFTYLFSTPGERGGEFRDPPLSEKLRGQLKKAKADVEATCFPEIIKK